MKGFSSPIVLEFAVFVGAISLVDGFIGLAAEWVSVPQGKIGLLIDGVIMIINIFGGILLAIKIGGAKCRDTSLKNRYHNLYTNELFNGGCGKDFGGNNYHCYNWVYDREKYLNSRCKESQADSVFMFLTVAILLASSTITARRWTFPSLIAF